MHPYVVDDEVGELQEHQQDITIYCAGAKLPETAKSLHRKDTKRRIAVGNMWVCLADFCHLFGLHNSPSNDEVMLNETLLVIGIYDPLKSIV